MAQKCPCAKNAQGLKGSRGSSLQGFEVQLPGRDDAQMRNAVGAPKVVDVETVAVEIADEDAIAVRVARRGADVDVLEQIDATHRLIGRDRPDCFGGVRHVFDLGDQRLLVGESLVERARHRILADHEPAGLDFVVARELLVVFSVPAILLRVEVGGVEIADVQKRHTRGRGRRPASCCTRELRVLRTSWHKKMVR